MKNVAENDTNETAERPSTRIHLDEIATVIAAQIPILQAAIFHARDAGFGEKDYVIEEAECALTKLADQAAWLRLRILRDKDEELKKKFGMTETHQ